MLVRGTSASGPALVLTCHDAECADWPGCWFQSAGELLGLQLPFPGP
jgi:hypothetical protein